jgi:hypothetical protein
MPLGLDIGGISSPELSLGSAGIQDLELFAKSQTYPGRFETWIKISF